MRVLEMFSPKIILRKRKLNKLEEAKWEFSYRLFVLRIMKEDVEKKGESKQLEEINEVIESTKNYLKEIYLEKNKLKYSEGG